VKVIRANLIARRRCRAGPALLVYNVIGPENEEIPAVATSPLWNESASVMFPESEQCTVVLGSDFQAQPHPTLFESDALVNTIFCGGTRSFSFSRALRVIGHETDRHTPLSRDRNVDPSCS